MNVTHTPTGALDVGTRSDIIQICIAAHAVITTRWLQPEGMALLKTAYMDGVRTVAGCVDGTERRGAVPTPEQTGIMILRTAQSPPLELDTLLTIAGQGMRLW